MFYRFFSTPKRVGVGVGFLFLLVFLPSVAGTQNTPTLKTSSKTSSKTFPQPPISLKKVSYAELIHLVRQHMGKVVVVDVWSTRCPPCMKGFPKVIQLQQDLANRGLETITVSLDAESPEQTQRAEKFLLKVEAKLTNVLLNLPESEAYQKFGIRSLPYLVVFDRNNRIALKLPRGEDAVDYDDLRAQVQKLLEAK